MRASYVVVVGKWRGRGGAYSEDGYGFDGGHGGGVLFWVWLGYLVLFGLLALAGLTVR